MEAIAMELVDQPEAVEVRAINGREVTILELRCAKEDLGKVIGRGGRMAKSIRNILDAVGMKQRKRYALEILE